MDFIDAKVLKNDGVREVRLIRENIVIYFQLIEQIPFGKFSLLVSHELDSAVVSVYIRYAILSVVGSQIHPRVALRTQIVLAVRFKIQRVERGGSIEE